MIGTSAASDLPPRRSERNHGSRCERCKTQQRHDAIRTCDFCGKTGCTRCVEQWSAYQVCPTCLGQ